MNIILTENAGKAEARIRARCREIHPEISFFSETGLQATLDRIPILKKSDLQRHMGSEDSWLENAVLFSETSGTTGKPLPCPRAAIDLNWNVINQMIAYKRFLQPGIDRVAILHPSVLSPFVEASSIALRQLNIGHVRVFPVPNVCDYERIFDVLERYKITALMSTPSLVYKLLYEFKKNDLQRIPSALKKLLLTGERLSLAGICNMRKIMGEESMIFPFVYGSSEAATVMIGRVDGLFEPILDDFVFELLPVKEKSGFYKLVISWLRDGMMPILRYDTGDYFSIEWCDGCQALKFLGRDIENGVPLELINQLESAIYSIAHPIFHFDCRLRMDLCAAQIDLVLTNTSASVLFEIKEKIAAVFPKWKVAVCHAKTDCGFLGFSPVTKMKNISIS